MTSPLSELKATSPTATTQGKGKKPRYHQTSILNGRHTDISDFWSGKLCEELKEYGYFQDQRTIALTFTGDGMSLTRQRNYTCFVCKNNPWPIRISARSIFY